jgi:formate dehydrogenase iron-sulfur subunit
MVGSGAPGYQNPADLNFITYTLVKFLQDGPCDDVDTDGNWNFLKFQCMHCLEPLCQPACPYNAIVTDGDGFVRIKQGRCRNRINLCTSGFTVVPPCAGACLFKVPKVGKRKTGSGWKKSARKCDACYRRRFPGNPELYPVTAAGNTSQYQAGDNDIRNKSFIGTSLKPACVTTCPSKAMQYGDRTAITTEANTIATDPDVVATYPEVNVYGAGAFGFQSRVILVLTRNPSLVAGNFYGFPNAFI